MASEQAATALATGELRGFYENMDFETYLAVPALNGSSIVHMRRSPMYFRYMRDNPQPSTPAQILGTATHRLILEPDRVGDFAVWGEQEEEKVRRGKVWDAFQEAHAGKMIVTTSERDAMVGMATAVRKYLPIRKYADAKGPTEVSIFWRDRYTGRRMKARLDKWIPESNTVFDLKTTRSCTSHQFAAQAFNLGYHIKMAIQYDGVRTLTGKEPKLKLGAVESKAPHESAVYRITPDVKLMGGEEFDALVRVLDECERTNKWPPALEEESDLLIPSWAATTEESSLDEFAEEEA